MKKLIFLVEEPSIAEILNVLLPIIIPDGILHQIISHDGKSDLEKSIPRKLRGWKEPPYEVSFIVMRDNDGSDCKKLKERLKAICSENGRGDSLIRIVCQELESWYLGDLKAVASAFRQPNLAAYQNKENYRNPDRLMKPAETMKKLVPGFSKIEGARAIAPLMDIDNNRSRSFQAFVEDVRRLVDAINESS